jgi:hypothetical protein
METTYTWEALDATSTRMTLRNRGEPSGFSRLVAPFMAAAMRRANRKVPGAVEVSARTRVMPHRGAARRERG